MSADLFRTAEDEFSRLRRELMAGRLTLEQFHDSLKQAKVKDALGREWAIGAETGKWYVRDEGNWVQANPYAVAQDASAASPQVETATPTPSTNPAPIPASAGAPAIVNEPIAAPPLASPSPFVPQAEQTEPLAPPTSFAAPLGTPAPTPVTSDVGPRRPARGPLYLLVIVLGMCAILLALVAVGVILAASRGLF